jgi:hypothetical protein
MGHRLHDSPQRACTWVTASPLGGRRGMIVCLQVGMRVEVAHVFHDPASGRRPLAVCLPRDRPGGAGHRRVRFVAARQRIIAGHGFVQNLRRGHYELVVEEPVNRRLAVAFDELALAI